MCSYEDPIWTPIVGVDARRRCVEEIPLWMVVAVERTAKKVTRERPFRTVTLRRACAYSEARGHAAVRADSMG